jgi:hypothetical protein
MPRFLAARLTACRSKNPYKSLLLQIRGVIQGDAISLVVEGIIVKKVYRGKDLSDEKSRKR